MKRNEIIVQDTITNLGNPAEVIETANSLADIIVKRNLAMALKGKRYVLVEGWQLAGAFCGIFPIVRKVENLSDDKRICYRAEVELIDGEGNVVGSGMAICTDKEKGKQQFGEYAICSMAQTRAVGKAMRLKLGWVMKLAGFQATPAEEVGVDGPIEEEGNIKEEVDYAQILKDSKDVYELYRAWISVPKAQKEELAGLKEELKKKFDAEKEK